MNNSHQESSKQDNFYQDNLQNHEVNFLKNLEFFKMNNIEIFDKIISHTNPKYQLGIDDSNGPNIWCQSKWLYDNNSIIFTDHQIEMANNKPEYIKLNRGSEPASFKDRRFLHQYYLEKIRTIKIETKDNSTNNRGENEFSILEQKNICGKYHKIPSLIIFGIGVGFHLENIIENKDPRSVFIFEPEFDFFYASLFTIQYEKVFNQHAKIILSIDEPWSVLWAKMFSHYHPSRLHEASKIQLICHYSGQKTIEAKNNIARSYGRLFDNAGFVEDEAVGINHFRRKLHQIKPGESLSILKNPQKLEQHNIEQHQQIERHKDTALIIGSGPSIDRQIEHIKALRDQFAIASCSSSIEILYRAGITPDFHVEGERIHLMGEYLTKMNCPEYLKAITLLTLNPTHPNLTPHFKKTITALKFGDIGAQLWQAQHDQNKDEDLPLLKCSGPTSGNCALAILTQMGFKTIIMAGLDFGQKDDGHHHSKSTLYYTDANRKTDIINSDFEVPSNTEGTVKTTLLLDKARHSAEILIRDHPHIRYLNISDGAKIEGAEFCTLNDSKANDKKANDNKVNDITAYLNTSQHVQSTLGLQSTLDERLNIVKIAPGEARSSIASFEKSWFDLRNNLEKICGQALTITSPPTSIFKWFDVFDKKSDLAIAMSSKNPPLRKLLIAALHGLQTSCTTLLLEAEKQDCLLEVGEKIIILWNSYMTHIPKHCRDTDMKTNDEILDILKPIFAREEL